MADPDSILSLLTSNTCNTLVQSEVNVSQLAGKVVGLYFAVNSSIACREFTRNLAQVYNELKAKGADFEVVLISDDVDKEHFAACLQGMPWLALPFHARDIEARLAQRFKIKWLPSLVLIDSDGKTVLSSKGPSLILRYGTSAYPFSEQQISKLKERQDCKALEFPETVMHPNHEHELERCVNEERAEWGFFVCSLCKEQGSGWMYSCSVHSCNFRLHPKCVDSKLEFEDGTESNSSEGEVGEEMELSDEGLDRLLEAIMQEKERIQEREKAKITEELVNREAKSVLLGGLVSAVATFVIALCTSCCMNSLDT